MLGSTVDTLRDGGRFGKLAIKVPQNTNNNTNPTLNIIKLSINEAWPG